MFRARERGMSFWPFAVSLLLLLAFVIMWFSATSERDQAKLQAQKAVDSMKAMEEERNTTNAKMVAVSKAAGFTGGSTTTDPAEIERQMKDYAGKLKQTMTAKFPSSRYQSDPN